MRYVPEKDTLSPAFFLFLFYIAVWWLQLGQRLGQRFGTEVRLEAIVAAILLTITCIDAFRKKPEEKPGFTPYILAFLAVLLLQVLLAYNTERAWFVYVQNVLKYSAMGILISRFVRTPRQLAWFVFVWMLACWKGTLEGVVGGITGSLVWENQGIMRLNGNGLWAHPNSFSQFALGAMPFCFYLYPRVKSAWCKWGIVSLFVFATYVVIYTGSRTGYLGFLLMLILLFRQASPQLRRAMVAGLLLLAPATCMLLPSYQERFVSSFTGQEKEGNSKGARIELYKQGVEVFLKHPFGVGLGNYREMNQRYYGRAMDQHCLLTEALTEIGIHGTIIFLMLLYKMNQVLRRIIAATDVPEGSDEVKFVHAVAKSFYLYFLLRLFVDLFSMDLYGIAWWFILGASSALYYVCNHWALAGAASAVPPQEAEPVPDSLQAAPAAQASRG